MARKPPKGKSLAEVNPELAKQWHTTKNGDLTPNDFSSGSGKKVWWKCDEGDDHEWEANIGNRVKGSGCSICSGHKVVISNSLHKMYPDLALEFHSFKNNNKTALDIYYRSSKNIWWKCSVADDHIWQATPESRVRGTGCPICAGKKVVKSNSLPVTHPDLIKEWHPTKNGILKASEFHAGSSTKVWWKCDKGDDHEWSSVIYSRKSGVGCPYCAGKKVSDSNSLANQKPLIAKEFHPNKNGELTPNDFTKGSRKKVWWQCSKDKSHEWITAISHRTHKNPTGCPYCSNQKTDDTNSLKKLYPNLFKQIHPTKNMDLNKDDLNMYSSKRIWWKCKKGPDHEWKYTVHERTRRGHNCPMCSGQKISITNSLNTLFPNLSKEWHPTKNGKLTPNDVTSKSGKNVWWKCDQGDDHEWKGKVSNRANGKGCPVCAGQIVVWSNSLMKLNPKTASEWHPTKNGNLTPLDVTISSNKKVWWKCNKGLDHEWPTKISDRQVGKGCPYCTLTPQSKQELTITFELKKFFTKINPKGFKTRVNGKLWTIDIYIPQLKLGIEFDGSYWHKDSAARDKLKTIQLEDEGIEIFRIREEPLKRIFEDDIMSKQPFNAKEVANNILKQIMKMYELDPKKIAKIQYYIAKKELQNEKGLDKYIDMILTEKAEKKL